jgi:3-phenylpropionate/trans-cinnamate dioxygenase ferredoxin reductase subunit
MSKSHTIMLGKQRFHARSGEVLLDAALSNGVDFPHDCRSGRCGTCLTRVKAGITVGGEAHQTGMVHACRALVLSDLAIEVEETPAVERIDGRLLHVDPVGEGVVELVIRPAREIAILPGQYCRFRFRGFPDRTFSPTVAMTEVAADRNIHLHVKRVHDGRVTPRLGEEIAAGHAVRIEGPFGHAHLRPGLSNRLVLVGGGTGFAPIWAIAAAALRENPHRQIVIVASTRRLTQFYMAPALEVASRHAGATIIAAIEELAERYHCLVPGRPIDHLPPLTGDDIVYAAGAPAMVDAVATVVRDAGSTFYSDPFEPNPQSSGSNMIETAKLWLRAG